MLAKSKQAGRLFISYRRSDARGTAGRLSDTLSAYFGDERVFRDIENIEGGADFADVIEQNLQGADAVIVLIGPDWLFTKNANGQRRLEDPADWVAEEIAQAIQLKKPIFPVLIDGASMPRPEELPEKLKPLTRYNAISVSDDRWKSDVTRLGKLLSLEIPSANERKLAWVNRIISLGLCISLSFASGVVTWNYLKGETALLQLWQSGVPFVMIIAATLLLSSIINLVDDDRKKFLYASMAAGAIGSLLFFTSLLFLEEAQETMVMFFGSLLTGTLMFAFMSMSGFKAK
jgi:hypothetical protein